MSRVGRDCHNHTHNGRRHRGGFVHSLPRGYRAERGSDTRRVRSTVSAAASRVEPNAHLDHGHTTTQGPKLLGVSVTGHWRAAGVLLASHQWLSWGVGILGRVVHAADEGNRGNGCRWARGGCACQARATHSVQKAVRGSNSSDKEERQTAVESKQPRRLAGSSQQSATRHVRLSERESKSSSASRLSALPAEWSPAATWTPCARCLALTRWK